MKEGSEGMWFKPQTWIAILALLSSVGFVVLPWIFSLGARDAKTPTRMEVKKMIEESRKATVSRVEYIQVQGQLQLVKKDVQYIRLRQGSNHTYTKERLKEIMQLLRRRQELDVGDGYPRVHPRRRRRNKRR